MGKQKSSRSMNAVSESMLVLKPPIHRIAANSIKKNAPVNKELFHFPLTVAAAQVKPNLISGFVRKFAKE